MTDNKPSFSLPLPFLQNGVAQVAIVVPNLEQAVEAYNKTFGVGPWHFYTYGKPLLYRAGDPPLIEVLELPEPITLVIGMTGVECLTAKTVARVRAGARRSSVSAGSSHA